MPWKEPSLHSASPWAYLGTPTPRFYLGVPSAASLITLTGFRCAGPWPLPLPPESLILGSVPSPVIFGSGSCLTGEERWSQTDQAQVPATPKSLWV